MQITEMEKRVNKEYRRMHRTLKGMQVPEASLKMMEHVLRNTAWISVKLKDATEEIGETPLFVEYDNGGGQTGVRESPEMKAYENLFRSYLSGVNKIMDLVPESDGKAEVAGQATVLELIQGRRKQG